MFCSETLIVGAILLAIEKIEHFDFVLLKSEWILLYVAHDVTAI